MSDPSVSYVIPVHNQIADLRKTVRLLVERLGMPIADFFEKEGEEAFRVQEAELIAKLIAYGRDRTEAIARMRRALDMFVVEGIYTTIPLHQRIMQDPDFIAGKFDTSFLTSRTRSH